MKKAATVLVVSLLSAVAGCAPGAGYYYDSYSYPGSYYGWGNYYGGYYGDGYYRYRYTRPYYGYYGRNYGYYGNYYRYGRPYPRPGAVTPAPGIRPGNMVRPTPSTGFQPRSGFAKPMMTPRQGAPMRSMPRGGGGAKVFPMQKM